MTPAFSWPMMTGSGNGDRKSTRLNSSHSSISYAVFCLKKKNTRDVLGRLPARVREQILANVRSEEPDVRGVVGKLTQGAAEAGFVYLTYLTGDLTAVELPPELQPTVAYGAGVVQGTEQQELAQRYLDGLTDGPCAVFFLVMRLPPRSTLFPYTTLFR